MKFLILSLLVFSLHAFAQEEVQPPAPTPAPPTDPYESARGAAQAGAGWVIGQMVGQVEAQKMDGGHKVSILNSYREALRGQLLMRYAFSHQSTADQVQGYAIPTWEGNDQLGHLCREIDMTMIYRYQIYFARLTSCLLEDGQWHESATNGNVGRSGTNPPGRGGGWLPPVPRK